LFTLSLLFHLPVLPAVPSRRYSDLLYTPFSYKVSETKSPQRLLILKMFSLDILTIRLKRKQYIAFFSNVWKAYQAKTSLGLKDFEAICFHLPYTKMGYK